MKRDMDLIRFVLLEARSGNPNGEIYGYDDDDLKYHRKLAIEFGLLEGKVQDNHTDKTNIPAAVFVKDLTWTGHDLLDSIESDTNWFKVKSFLLESGKTITIEAIKNTVKCLF